MRVQGGRLYAGAAALLRGGAFLGVAVLALGALLTGDADLQREVAAASPQTVTVPSDGPAGSVRLSDSIPGAARDMPLHGSATASAGLDGTPQHLMAPSSGPAETGTVSQSNSPDLTTRAVTTISVMSTSATTATATVTVDAAGTYHLRFSEVGQAAWQTAPSVTASAAGDITFSLTGMKWSNPRHDVQVSESADFATIARKAQFFHRPASLDFSLDSSHRAAHGIWGNTSTFWVASDGSGTDNKLLAYKRTAGMDYGTRDSSKDLTLPNTNRDPRGIWSDGTTLWVADNRDYKLYTYTLADRTATDPSTDLMFDSAHESAPGLWGNDDTLYAVTIGRTRNDVVAYSRADATYGDREPAKDIDLDGTVRANARGIWSDGSIIWVANDSDNKLYAFDLKTGARWQSGDIPLVSGNGSPYGVWGHENTIWVVNNHSAGKQVFAYYRPQPGPSVSGIEFSSATQSATTISVGTVFASATDTLYLRHRDVFDTTWSSAVSKTAAATVEFSLTRLRGGRFEFQASFDSTFADGTEVTKELFVRPQQQDFTLTNGPEARGLWTDGTTLWAVIDEDGARRVDAYNLTTKAYDAAKSFTFDGDNTTPRGVYANSSTMWVVDGDDKVYAYTITSGASFGSLDSSKTFTLEPAGIQPTGAWSDGSTLWIASHVHERVYAYNISTTGTFGERDETKEGDLDTGYGEPLGLWSDGTRLWVVDGRFDRVYAYGHGSTVGARLPAAEIPLPDRPEHAWGIAGNSSFLWVADSETGVVYAYLRPAAPSGDITAVSFDRIDRTEADITVTITNASSTMRTAKLQYTAPGGTVTDTSKTTDGTSLEFELAGLATGTHHDVRVTLDDTDTFHTGGFKTLTETEQKGYFLKSVVEEYEEDHGWVRETYDGMRRLYIPVSASAGGLGGLVLVSCVFNAQKPTVCTVASYAVSSDNATDKHVYLHELGHVYGRGDEFLDEYAGIGWLYFKKLAAGGSNCDFRELYADGLAANITSSFETSFIYFNQCSKTGDTPSATTKAVVTSITADEIPDWFDTTYTDDSVPYDTSADDRYSAKYDLEAVWRDVKAPGGGRSERASMLSALGHAFGGYCDAARAHNSSSVRNPWRLGGCSPQAPTVTLAANGRATWVPGYDGGENITGWRVHWRAADQGFDDARSTRITNGSTRSYQTSVRGPGTAVRVKAINRHGESDFGEASVPLAAPGPPSIISVTGEDGGLLVTWNEPTSTGGTPITRYDVRSILTATLNDGDPNNDTWTEVTSAWTSGDLSYSIMGLTNGQQYTVQVRAANSVGPGANWSAGRTGTPASADATLSTLALSEGRLNPAFAGDTETYSASVGFTVTQLTVTATATEADATISFTGAAADGRANLAVGGNNVINVKVTAPNGSTTRTYTVTVTRTQRDTGLTPASSDPRAPFASTATYTVRFTGWWNTTVTPGGFPGSPHFSPLVGAVHNVGVSFLRDGAMASAGVESVAEIGATTQLKTEVQTAIDNGQASSILERAGNIGRLASVSFSATLPTTHPRVTLISMIAPSPDWFVGVSGRPLLNSSGRWLRSHSVNLYPWDAGTEDGTEFSLSNPETDPSGVITSIRGTGKFTTNRIAALSFELQAVTTTRTVAENTPAARNIGPPVAGTDVTGDVTYTLGGTDADSFVIVATTGQLRTKAALNHEDKGEYEVVVTATDDDDATITTDTTVTITVTDVPEPPEIGGEATRTIEENGPRFVGSYTATDPEGTDTTWLDPTGTDRGHFTFDPDMGELSFVNTPDYDRATNGNHGPVYRVTLRASDASNQVGTLPVTITLTPVNEGPLIEGGTAFDVNEGQSRTLGTYTKRDPEGQTTNWGLSGQTEALTGDDADAFSFDKSNGRLTFAAQDYEAPTDDGGDNTYEITLNANDGSLNGALDITVTVTNIEEIGALTVMPQTGVNGEPLQATLTDPDIVSTQTWKWQRSSSTSGPWTDIANTNASTYTAEPDDVNHYLRAHVTYRDGSGTDEVTLTAATSFRTVNDASANAPPVPPDPLPQVADVPENARPGRNVVLVRFTDPEGDRLTYSLVSDQFAIDSRGQITVKQGAQLDYETTMSYSVTVRATDQFGAVGTATLTIGISDVNEAPTAEDDAASLSEDRSVTIDVLANDTDPENDDLTVTSISRPSNGSATLNSDGTITYTPNANYHGSDSFTYRAREDHDGQGVPELTSARPAAVSLTIDGVNDAPTFASATAERSVPGSAQEGDRVGAPLTATDIDTGDTLSYELQGADASSFDIDNSGQITVATTNIASQDTYSVTVEARDRAGETATIEVTITVMASPAAPPTFVGIPGGGGGPPPGPTPSEEDFEWTVDRDIEALDESNAAPEGGWSDGETLWILDNAEGAGDAVYAYDLETGERLEDREFALHETNRAPRGVWSDGEGALWVSDSGHERLFAYSLESGERLEEREIVLARRNADARGIWSDGETIWVLDGGKDSLFAYDLESGAFIAEYALADANGDPRGLWSDGVTIWVGDHGAKRLFAYRLPVSADGDGGASEEDEAEDLVLERVSKEDFTEPGRVGNNSPRGIWSDGAVMYVADANDGKVYSYNMPDATDARLEALEIGSVDFGEFSPLRHDYASETIPHGNISTVTATPIQPDAGVGIEPSDHDGDPANGHQLRLIPGLEVTVTVTSPDGSRMRIYRVVLGEEEAGKAAPDCLRGAIDIGFSLVVSGGGSLEGLVSCAEGRHVTALYALSGSEYVPYIVGAPDFVNERFAGLFADGVPALTPLTVKSEGPATAALAASTPVGPFATCLQGELAEGFSLVIYEGGSVDELAVCAEGLGITSLYVLSDGVWVSYILGAPGFVNDDFRELFEEGVPTATPLTVRRG